MFITNDQPRSTFITVRFWFERLLEENFECLVKIIEQYLYLYKRLHDVKNDLNKTKDNNFMWDLNRNPGSNPDMTGLVCAAQWGSGE